MDIQPSDVVRDLRVLLDSELTLKHHANRIASTCFYHLCRLRQLKRHLGVEVMKQLISSFIFSRLDYCNALLIGLPLCTVVPLQLVQNAALRLLLVSLLVFALSTDCPDNTGLWACMRGGMAHIKNE